MPPTEPQATVDRRLLWMSAFAVALWLFLVNPSTALAGGDYGSDGWDSSDHSSDSWQHGEEGTPPSWGHTPDQGQPPEGSGTGQPCENQGPPKEQPPAETPPAETAPEHSPPVDTPPEHKPPEVPPGETPPEHTPPVETP